MAIRSDHPGLKRCARISIRDPSDRMIIYESHNITESNEQNEHSDSQSKFPYRADCYITSKPQAGNVAKEAVVERQRQERENPAERYCNESSHKPHHRIACSNQCDHDLGSIDDRLAKCCEQKNKEWNRQQCQPTPTKIPQDANAGGGAGYWVILSSRGFFCHWSPPRYVSPSLEAEQKILQRRNAERAAARYLFSGLRLDVSDWTLRTAFL